MAFRTWEQIGAAARKKMKRRTARFQSVCPCCKRTINPGDAIVQAYVPGKVDPPHKGERNVHAGVWHCSDCAEFYQRGVDCGYLVSTGAFLGDRQAFEARTDVQAWLTESRFRRAS